MDIFTPITNAECVLPPRSANVGNNKKQRKTRKFRKLRKSEQSRRSSRR